ncbi:MAG TPA: hypothetical protein VLM87_12640, partial [Rubrivivax sp.]|nr:hypothetical protein [Rubrivivax sp.]
MRWLTLLLPLLLWLQAAPAADDAERASLSAERQALIERFAQEELACQQRFFVNACVEDVSRRRREALAPLRARELELDDAERQQRAAGRRAVIEAKQREHAARPAPVPASAPELSPRPTPEHASTLPASAASASQQPSAEAQARAAQAAERARAAQRRREEAAAALERVRRRL